MDNQDINLFLIKKIQTESIIKSEKRKLNEINAERKRELDKYNYVRTSFQNTKNKIINMKNNELPGQINNELSQIDYKKLKKDKSELELINERVTRIEEKVKKQNVIVLVNKKKLEMLQEKLFKLLNSKIQKKNLREELEIIDAKIHQFISNAKIQNKTNIQELEDDIYLESEIEESEYFKNIESQLSTCSTEEQGLSLNQSDLGFKQNENMSFQNNYEGNKQKFVVEEIHVSDEKNLQNQTFEEQISKLSYYSDSKLEELNLNYKSPGGSNYTIKLRRNNDNTYEINIHTHSKKDLFNLSSAKLAIEKTFREKGFLLSSVVVKEFKNGEFKNAA